MTRLRGMTVSAALVAGLMIPAVSLAAPASAMPAAHGPWQTYHDGPFGEIQEDFCDVSGLTVDFSFEDDGAYRYAIRPPDDFYYNISFHDGYNKYTNVDTGESVTWVVSGSWQDVRITDNGDGTYTIHETNKGHGAFYSDDGELLARYAGAFSYTISFDDNGTPSDPSDDIKLPPPTIVRDVGLKPDDCAVIVAAIG